MRVVLTIAILHSLAAILAIACNATESCDDLANNRYMGYFSLTSDGRPVVNDKVLECCAVMPATPLVDTGIGTRAYVITPPSMMTPGAVCPLTAGELHAQSLSPSSKSALFRRERILAADHEVPSTELPGCQKSHTFYTKYVLARSNGSSVWDGIPVLGSEVAPDAAVLKAAETIAEMLRQLDGKIPGLRASMVNNVQRFAVWADAERRQDTCNFCKKVDPTFDCDKRLDSRAGRDASLHPEVPKCQEPGGGGTMNPTSFAEEYGIPYIEPDGSVRDSYCGTNIVAHEFFHAVHDVAIKHIARPLYLKINESAARAVSEGIYTHHPGEKDDGCNQDFEGCIAYEFVVKAHMVWNGFPSDRREFRYQSRREMKLKSPWIAELISSMFEDGDWNPAFGVVIDEPRDQTFGLTCKTAPGSALCGRPLSKEFIGPPMQEVLLRCGQSCWDHSHLPGNDLDERF